MTCRSHQSSFSFYFIGLSFKYNKIKIFKSTVLWFCYMHAVVYPLLHWRFETLISHKVSSPCLHTIANCLHPRNNSSTSFHIILNFLEFLKDVIVLCVWFIFIHNGAFFFHVNFISNFAHPFTAVYYPIVWGIPQFVYSFTSWRTFALFANPGSNEQFYHKHFCTTYLEIDFHLVLVPH